MMLVRANPTSRAAEIALQIYEQTLIRVDGGRLMSDAVHREADLLFIHDEPFDLTAFDRVLVAGAGKASTSMARSIARILGARCAGGLVIGREADDETSDPFELLLGDHPIPGARSLAAGAKMLEFAHSCRADDLVLFMLSGGASALMEALPTGLSLESLQATNAALLASGADIGHMNAVRRHLSRVKDGRLGQAFGAATVIVLVLSDVMASDLSVVGSGLFLHRPGPLPIKLVEGLPEAAQLAILRAPPVTAKPTRHFVVGGASLALQVAAGACRGFGVEAIPFANPMQGEARIMARRIVQQGQAELDRRARPFCLLFGGETTVHLREVGRGGRCQEMALVAAPRLEKMLGCAFLAAGTDGSDGPTDAAGALVDPSTCNRSPANWIEALRRHQSYDYLEASDSLIRTGPTGSNVNDLALFVAATE